MNWLPPWGKQSQRIAELESTCSGLKEEIVKLADQLRKAQEQFSAREDAYAAGTKQWAVWWDQQIRLWLPTQPIPPFDWATAALATVLAKDNSDYILDALARGTFLDLKYVSQFPERRPVFVLGAARSGTTAICNALRSQPNLFGWGEGHVFSTLFPMLVLFQQRWQSFLASLSEGDRAINAAGHLDVYQLLNGVLRNVDEAYAGWCSEKGSVRWIDKTPTVHGVLVAGLLRHVYPQSRFVFMIRHPLTNILSNVRKFSRSTLISAINSWFTVATSWLKVRPTLESGTYLELQQEDLTPRANEVGQNLAAFLDLAPSEAEGVSNYLRSERPERTGNSSDSDVVRLEDLDWPEDVKRTCRELCEVPASVFGYRLSRQ